MTKTDVGMLKGKLSYMSPEHCRGEMLDRRADVFGLGIVLYEMITGRHLFRAPTQAATLRALLLGPIVPSSELAPDVPPALEAVCMKALQRARRKRYQSAADMRRDLLKVVHGTSDEAMPEESLAELMRRLFTDRIEQKREMLARVAGGEDVDDVPAPVADPELELPSVVASTPDTGTAETTGVKLRGGRAPIVPLWVLALAVLAGISTGIVAWNALVSRDGEPASSQQAAASPARTPRVNIRIESTPAGASVTWDGTHRGQTPVAVEADRSSRPTEIVLALDGFAPLTETVVPDVDQRLRFSLRADSSAPPAEAPSVAERDARPRRPHARPAAMTMAPAMGFQRWD